MFLVIAFPSYYILHLLTYYWPTGAPMQRRSQGAGGPPPVMKSGCPRNCQNCNKIDTLEGIIEIASATALFYLERTNLFI